MNFIKLVFCIAWRKNLRSFFRMTPDFKDMIMGPRTVSCDLVCILSTEFIRKHQKVIVYPFYVPVNTISLNFFWIVKLCSLAYLLQHVSTNHRIVSVAYYFAAKKNLYCRICASNSYCVYKNITRIILNCFNGNFVESEHLPKQSEARI